jgi:hypothetical protein
MKIIGPEGIPVALAIPVATLLSVAIPIGGIYFLAHVRHKKQLEQAVTREMFECVRPLRRVDGRDDLFRELTQHLQWIARFRDGDEPAQAADWCRWKIERELGLRADMPPAGPPPTEDLPTPAALIGATRARVLSELGEPAGCGRWEASPEGGKRWLEMPCAEARRLGYVFYYLPRRYVGGGPELVLAFDDSGVCTAASWTKRQ